MQDIAQLVDDIRELINRPRKQYALLQDEAMWAMLCSSMDAIEDTELCFDAFLTEDIDRADDGVKYVFVYGVLQALFVQQDAVQNFHEALNIPYTQNPSLGSIRKIRNDSVGHPTKRGEGQGRSYNFISRITLGSQGFQLRTIYRDGQQDCIKNVNVPELITTQRDVFVDVLDNVIKTLENEEMEHRKKFEGKKLAGVFFSTSYPMSKIFEAILNPQSAHARLGEVHVDRILGSIEAFKTGLKEREILEAYEEGVTYTLEEVDYPLQELRTYFRNRAETHINEKDAYIFATFVDVQVQKLLQIAEEIDEEYSQDSI